MTLPASGNSISLGQVNTELGRSATATIDMNDSAVRSLFGVGGSGTTISMSSGFGKSAVTISLASITSNEPFEGSALAPGEACAVNLDFNSDGTWDAVLEALGGIDGNWATPTTANIGSSYWIRFTRTFFSGGFGNSASGSTGWVQIGAGQGVQVYNSGTNSSVSATYTIEISTNSSGTNIVASASGIDLVANLFGV
jgi:hypothetical protein